MWISRTRYTDMRAQIERLVDQRDDARRDAAAHLSAARRTAARNTHLSEQLQDAMGYERRIVRMTRAAARLSAALTTQTRRADRLQQRLDAALGLDSPAIADGALWQQHRTDKPEPGPKGSML
ncbi:hypothetical protein CU044_2131 [Streptomyces sp. L-9-10]|uniref:hypothetical protein n=1 Tax=Streptomyces sp. L-9-10 TaxID=1478131 RepID=UPI00101D2C76|nr:hypothetical protein [Streptomyces sp. L-9-10]RYJ29390.1 hypothetical protein CU044_2131 [Streptomyces sp. L-9-10]